jgi:hypothetical protein
MLNYLKRKFSVNKPDHKDSDIALIIEKELQKIHKSAEIIDTSNDIANVIHHIKIGQEATLKLKQLDDLGYYKADTKVSDCIDIFFNLKEAIVHKAIKRSTDEMLTNIDMLNSNEEKIVHLEKFIDHLSSFWHEYSEDNHIYVKYLEQQLLKKVDEFSNQDDGVIFKISVFADSNVPSTFDWNNYHQTEQYFENKKQNVLNDPYSLHFV